MMLLPLVPNYLRNLFKEWSSDRILFLHSSKVFRITNTVLTTSFLLHIASAFSLFFLKVNGGYGAWSDNDKCSKSCGSGTKTRRRLCNNPTPKNGGDDCSKLGPANQSVTCNPQVCPPGEHVSFNKNIIRSNEITIIMMILNCLLTLFGPR